MLLLLSEDSDFEAVLRVARHMGFLFFLLLLRCKKHGRVEIDVKTLAKYCLIPANCVEGGAQCGVGNFINIAKAQTRDDLMRYIRRADISALLVDIDRISTLIDTHILNLLIQYDKFIVIDFRNFIVGDRSNRLRIIRQLKRRGIYFLNKTKVNFVYSISVNSVFEMVSSRQFRSLLLYLGIKDNQVKKGTKEHVIRFLEAPMEFIKMDQEFYESLYKRCILDRISEIERSRQLTSA